MNDTLEILIMSDIHGNHKKADDILRNETYDLSFFCGDSELSDSWVDKRFNFSVRGNNDFSSFLQTRSEIKLENFKIFITHGHEFGSYQQLMNYDRLIEAFGLYKSYNLVLYGHTHFPNYFESKNDFPAFLNPGSITYPRFGSSYSYAKVLVDIVNAKILKVEFKTWN